MFVTFASEIILKKSCLMAKIANLAELKARITQHVHNLTPKAFRSVVEYSVYRLQLVEKNSGLHLNAFCASLAIINRCFHYCFYVVLDPKAIKIQIIIYSS